MKRKMTAILLGLAAVLLAACGKTEAPEPAEGFSPAMDTSAGGRIQVAGNYANFEALEAVFADFNAIYPNVELSYFKPDDYNNTIGIALESAEAPDIYVSFSWMVEREEYAKNFAYAEDLSDPSLGIDLDVIRPSLLRREDDGAVLMVPVFATTYGMLINNDLFEKEGIAVPGTYQELVSACDAFREKGYESPLLGYPESSSSLMYAIGYPLLCAELAGSPEMIEKANVLDPSAGEMMRAPLELLADLVDRGCIDLEACSRIEDNYSAVIMRFFEGDVPMMICTGDTVSGTKKRESQSEAFTASPFTYSFCVIPTTDEGGWLVDGASIQFCVNRNSKNLQMANEFMRFLISEKELNKMSEIKRLVTPTKDFTYDAVYTSLGEVPAERIVSPDALHILDAVSIEFRAAAERVVTGECSVDEAVARFGTFSAGQ